MRRRTLDLRELDPPCVKNAGYRWKIRWLQTLCARELARPETPEAGVHNANSLPLPLGIGIYTSLKRNRIDPWF
ncbi:MAG: hypothetical protein ACM3U2_03735 [Deltaproteobacteria bacterium]